MRLYKKKKKKNHIHVQSMLDGQIGIIVDWHNNTPHHIGKIVQRHDRALILLGAESGESWLGVFASDAGSMTDCKVKILKPGTKLVV